MSHDRRAPLHEVRPRHGSDDSRVGAPALPEFTKGPRQDTEGPRKARELHDSRLDSTLLNDRTFRKDYLVTATYAETGTDRRQRILERLQSPMASRARSYESMDPSRRNPRLQPALEAWTLSPDYS